MIIREATADDLRPLAAFIKRQLAAWGYDHAPRLPLSEFRRRWKERRWRFALVEEDGVIVAALEVFPAETDRGRAFEIRLWLVAHDHPDKPRVLDALALWGCNYISAEGRRIALSYDPMKTPVVYGRDLLEMDAPGHNFTPTRGLLQWGDTETIIKVILQRRPEWVLSL